MPWLLVGVALGVALAGVAAGGPAASERPAARPAVAAHRGGALLWPENSLLAFRQALALGVTYLELDVHLSRDGHPVVIHDPTLDRTTSGRGPVRALGLDELRLVRLRDAAGTVTPEPLPTLDEVLELAAHARCRLLVEIKVDERRQRYPAVEETVLAALDRHGMTPFAVIMAFEAATWRRVLELRPGMLTAALYSPRMLEGRAGGLEGALAEARAAGVRVVGLHHALVTPDAVARARAAGLTVGAWTVNEAAAIRRVVEAGVDVVISDRPDLALEIARR
jgi:glycerophosphoryl diester phosphodiesterase